jgi:hypothetical protein
MAVASPGSSCSCIQPPPTSGSGDGAAQPASATSATQQAMGSGGFWVFVLVGLKIFELYAKRTPTLKDDAIAAFVRSIVDRDQNPIKIDPK